MFSDPGDRGDNETEDFFLKKKKIVPSLEILSLRQGLHPWLNLGSHAAVNCMIQFTSENKHYKIVEEQMIIWPSCYMLMEGRRHN